MFHSHLRRFVIPGLVAGVALLSAGAVHAQQKVAIVVGVGDYQYDNELIPDGNGGQIKPFEDLAPACVNDADLFESVLRARGFQVHKLSDTSGQAPTRANILAYLERLQGTQPAEFVFYFSGHGTRLSSGEGALCPSDYRYNQQENALRSLELRSAVRAIQARASSVVLDSCYSGALTKRLGLISAGVRPKCIRPKVPSQGRLSLESSPRASGMDVSTRFSGGQGDSGICYFTASEDGQLSWTDGDASTFTRHVTAFMRRAATWGTLNSLVSEQLAQVPPQRRQTPVLSSGYASRAYFANAAGVTPIAVDDVGDLLSLSNPNPAALSIEGDYINNQEGRSVALPAAISRHYPDDDSRISELILYVNCRKAGYLVVVNQDTENRVRVLFPSSLNAKDGYVSGADRKRIPEDTLMSLKADKTGQERVKAILFTSEAAAQAFLSGYRGAGDKSAAGLFGAKFTPSARSSASQALGGGYVTADVNVTVQEEVMP